MKSTYPFTKCLNPLQIVNPHTRDVLKVPCGKCEACNNQKSSMRALKCKLESCANNYTLFVTLTYANEYVPLMYGYFNVKPDLMVERKIDFVDKEYNDEIVCSIRLSLSQLTELQNKCNLGESLPYLRKRDLQLFMKRLRKNLTKYTDEKIRYYAVGEYGPVHFRPHYHLLIWFNQGETEAAIRKVIHKSWQFGRIDIQVPEGDCAKYVAGYINGFGNLPRVYKARSTKPFAVHSRYLGESVLKSEKEEVYKLSASDFVTRSINLNGTHTEFSLWRSLKTAFYPRCPKFALRTTSECYTSYRTYADVREWTREASAFKQAKIVVDAIVRNYDVLHLPVLKYFASEYKIDPFIGRTHYEKALRQVYMELRTSQHFLHFVCDDIDNPYHQLQQVKMIEHFYEELDLLNLNQQCVDMNEFIKYDSDEIDDYLFFYDNTWFDANEFKQKKFFRRFQEKELNNASKNIKHKVLNDENLKFNY